MRPKHPKDQKHSSISSMSIEDLQQHIRSLENKIEVLTYNGLKRKWEHERKYSTRKREREILSLKNRLAAAKRLLARRKYDDRL